MKQVILFLTLFANLHVQAQQTANIDSKRADELVDKINGQTITTGEREELHNMAIVVQNNGQELDEKYRQYKKSLTEIDRAVFLFTALNDTLDIANNRKYKGYLLGRMGKFKEAKNETKIAIDLYKAKKMDAGVAVSQFDIARIYEYENKPDSAIFYAELSRTFWKTKAVDLRVLIINNMLVSLALKANDADKAKAIQQESVFLVAKPQMHWQAVVDFYFTSKLLFETINDASAAATYRQQYAAKTDALRRQGIAAKSYYESDR